MERLSFSCFHSFENGVFIYCNTSIRTLSLVRETITVAKKIIIKSSCKELLFELECPPELISRLLFACGVIIFDGQGKLFHKITCARGRDPSNHAKMSTIQPKKNGKNHEKMCRIDNSNEKIFPLPTCISFRPSYTDSKYFPQTFSHRNELKA